MAPDSFDEQIDEIEDPYLLVRLLLEEGENLSPKLRAKIISKRSAVVSPLINLLNNEAVQMEQAPGQGWAPIHAVALLGELKAEEAIQPMLNWLAKTEAGEDILHSKIITGLGALGEAAYQPMLDAFEQAADKDLRRSLCDALVCSGIRNDRIFNIILDFFKADKGYGAMSFALYGDPKALDHLHYALSECEYQDESQNLFANQIIIDLTQAIIELGGQFTRDEAEKLKRVNAQRNKNAKKVETFFEQVEEDIHPVKHKLGRNDPCWCGSGKKYKHCHWPTDHNLN